MTAMTISDTERREVARRLRGQAKKLGPNMDAHEFAHYTADVIDVNECMTWYEMELRLADLIEPPTQCPYYHSDRHHCSAYDDVVDRDALLKLADEMQRELDECASDHEIAGKLQYQIDCIREALGVSDD